MGLDMYLEAEVYVSGYDHCDQTDRAQYTRILNAAGMNALKCADAPMVKVAATVAYWRKANQVHAWFVKNIQEDADTCERFYVSRQMLEKLVMICEEILGKAIMVDGKIRNGKCGTVMADGEIEWVDKEAEGQVVVNHDEIRALLPPSEGFFFGSSDIDNFFMEDIESTVSQLKPLLDGKYREFTFYYQASW